MDEAPAPDLSIRSFIIVTAMFVMVAVVLLLGIDLNHDDGRPVRPSEAPARQLVATAPRNP